MVRAARCSISVSNNSSFLLHTIKNKQAIASPACAGWLANDLLSVCAHLLLCLPSYIFDAVEGTVASSRRPSLFKRMHLFSSCTLKEEKAGFTPGLVSSSSPSSGLLIYLPCCSFF